MSGFENVGKTIEFALRLKADMQKIGKSRGRRKCPREHADGQEHYVHARLLGAKQHIHMACDDPACDLRLME